MKTLSHISTLVLIVAVLTVACQGPAPSTPTAALSLPTSTPTAAPSPTPTHTPTPTKAATPTPTATPAPIATPELFEVVLTEQQLTELAQKGIARDPDSPVNAESVYVRLEPGQVVAGGETQVLLLTMDVEVVAEVDVQDGKPLPKIVDIRVDGRQVPAPLRTTLLKMADPYLQRWTEADLAVYIEDVEITRGQARIVGRYK